MLLGGRDGGGVATSAPLPCLPHSLAPGRVPSRSNVFFPIYLALRLKPDTAQDEGEAAAAPPPALPGYAPAIGGVAAAVGLFSIGWALAARPEVGGLAERWEYLTTLLATSRVDWAFGVDASLYCVWQAWLLGACGAAPRYRFVPFFGLAAWLIAGPQSEGKAEA